MSGDRPSRRKVLSGVIGTACGLSIASGAAGAETSIEKTYYEDSANPAVTLRSDSPISLEKIAETRFEFLEKFNYRGNSEQVVFSYPRRDDIVAYNLVMDDAPREYIGHQKKNTNRRLSEDGAEVHANADKHLQKFKDADYSTQLTSNEDFNDWERVGSFYEEDEETTGNLLLEATCYRKHEASENYKNDAYAIVSEGEIGGSETGNVGTGIHNNELKIKHNWARNADMDDRYPQSMTTGEKTEGASFEVNISWPPGINVGGSSEYTQNDVRTLDESSPWFDYGE